MLDSTSFVRARKLRTPEAAQDVGLAPATLAKLRCVGGGPSFTKLGRAVVYDLVDLDKWVAKQGKRRSTCDVPTTEPCAERA